MLYPRSLLGCVWLSPSCVCWMLALSSMRCPRWILYPVYGIARKCDRIATTSESKQKQSITIKQQNDVSSILYSLIESTRLHRFHALGAGGREFESRHSDHKKSHDKPFINAVLSWPYLLYIGLKMAGKCDKFRKNLFCAPLFCMLCPISYGCIMGCYMPMLRGYRKSLYPYNPA